MSQMSQICSLCRALSRRSANIYVKLRFAVVGLEKLMIEFSLLVERVSTLSHVGINVGSSDYMSLFEESARGIRRKLI